MTVSPTAIAGAGRIRPPGVFRQRLRGGGRATGPVVDRRLQPSSAAIRAAIHAIDAIDTDTAIGRQPTARDIHGRVKGRAEAEARGGADTRLLMFNPT